MTPDQQLQALQAAPAWPVRPWWAPSLATAALGLAGVALAVPHWPWTLAAAVAATLAALVSRVDRHRRDAVLAARRGRPAMAQVSLACVQRDGLRVWRAIVRVDMLCEWGFPFEPQHWVPTEGVVTAEVRFVPGVAWPALVLAGPGLLYPSAEPRRRIPR